METVPLFIQKVGVVLSGIMSHVIMSDARKATCLKGIGVMILIKGKRT